MLLKTVSVDSREDQLTREEISGQRKQLKRHADFTSIQIFEVSFYNLLSQLSLHKKQIKDSLPTHVLDVFRYLRTNLLTRNKNQNYNDGKAYGSFYAEHHHFLGVYFRMLYNLLKFVNTSNIINKKEYTDKIRATLSNDELFLIDKNCRYHAEGRKKLNELCIKYNILKHIESP